jgi:hypothetical protein
MIVAGALLSSGLVVLAESAGNVSQDRAVLKAAVAKLCRGNDLVFDSISVEPSRVESSRLWRSPLRRWRARGAETVLRNNSR